MIEDAVESIIRRVMADESYRADVKLCLGCVGESQTVGTLRELLKAAPVPIDFEEWAFKVRCRKDPKCKRVTV